mmetsp:Transcript_4060/g.6255  ORF Transcript_4060/g.6255 Transcript_4060/m.6255 type:complete len:363 (+) Transcript_4060:161-1249(+)
MFLTTQMLCDESMIGQALEVINSQPRHEGSFSLYQTPFPSTALYFCCCFNSSPIIMEALLRKWPEDINSNRCRSKEETPVDVFFGVDNNRQKREQPDTNEDVVSFSYQTIELSRETTIVSELDTIKLLTNAYMLLFVINNGSLKSHIDYANIYSSYYSSTTIETDENEEDKFLVLHASLEERRCPILFSHLFLKQHPKQAWKRNANSKLPIELALACNKINSVDDGETTSFLNSLFKLCPTGASFPDDLHSRLPLTKCAAMGLDVALSDDEIQPPTMVILKFAPRALFTHDIATHMLPFMFVAARGTHFSGGKSHHIKNKPSEETKRKLGLARPESSRQMHRLDNLSKLYSWIMLDPNTLFT